jgi:hypothetical protein
LQLVLWKMVHFALFLVKISINFSPSYRKLTEMPGSTQKAGWGRARTSSNCPTSNHTCTLCETREDFWAGIQTDDGCSSWWLDPCCCLGQCAWHYPLRNWNWSHRVGLLQVLALCCHCF